MRGQAVPGAAHPEELTHSMSGYEGKVTEHPEIPYDYVVYYGYPATRSQDYQ